jgi:hypothetical protein
MDTIRLRSSARRPVVVGVVFLMVMAPILTGLLVSSATVEQPTWSTLYLVAATAPAVGMLIAVIMLVAVLWRRSRPLLLIDDHVSLPPTGVRFPLRELDHLQLYTVPGRGTFLVLLPAHVPERFPQDPRAVAPYTVKFPEGGRPQPMELVDLIVRRTPWVGVDKQGTVQRVS